MVYPLGALINQVFDYSREAAKKQPEVSLKHLKVDYLDALLLHELDVVNHGDHYQERFNEAMEGTYQT